MIKIAIVEDEAMYAKQLEEFLRQYEKENEIGRASCRERV